MSTTPPTPSAAAVRAAQQIVPNGTEGTITAALAVMPVAALIDAEIRPLLEALEELVDDVTHHDHCPHDWSEQVCVRKARAALRRATERAGT